jgi:hypothetical protein
MSNAVISNRVAGLELSPVSWPDPCELPACDSTAGLSAEEPELSAEDELDVADDEPEPSDEDEIELPEEKMELSEEDDNELDTDEVELWEDIELELGSGDEPRLDEARELDIPDDEESVPDAEEPRLGDADGASPGSGGKSPSGGG